MSYEKENGLLLSRTWQITDNRIELKLNLTERRSEGRREPESEEAHGGMLDLARQSDGPLSAIKWHKTGWPFSGRIPEHQEHRNMAVVQDQRNMEVSFCFLSPGCAAVPALDKEGT